MPHNSRVPFALVPAETHALFSGSAGNALAPVFYTVRETGYVGRLARKLGHAAARRLSIENTAHLPEVTKLWLAAQVRLTRDETVQLLELLPRLEWVYSQRTGTDHLPLDLYRARGIAVSNTGDLSSLWVAEMHLACVLAHAKRLPVLAAQQGRHGRGAVLGRELQGMNLLVLGTGRIGGHTARLCRAVGVHVTGASRDPQRFAGHAGDYDAVVALDTALAQHIMQADVVIMALPLERETRHLLTADIFTRMKADAAFINLARPALADESALLAALRSGRLGAAWLSEIEAFGFRGRWRAERLPNLHLTHFSEAHVASKLEHAFAQFTSLARQPLDRVQFRVV